MKCNFIRAAARLTAALFITISAITGCGQSRKLARIRGEELAAGIRLPASSQAPPQLDSTRGAPVRDTLRVTGLDGRELLIMRAVRDEASGEMVATEQLDAAVVTARFRNVAERHGRIDLEFQVTVPPEMHDSHWQLRLHPDMFILGDSLRLDDVVITGADYRKAQLKGCIKILFLADLSSLLESLNVQSVVCSKCIPHKTCIVTNNFNHNTIPYKI